MSVRVGINGFRRICRSFWRAVHASGGGDIEIVAANDLGDGATCAHLLKCDTLLGTLDVDAADVVGTPYSCTFDSQLTMAFADQVRVIGWYDNEWGYSNRLVDLAVLVGSQLG